MLFGVHPWQMLYLDDVKRTWYEMAAVRHRNREHEQRQEFLNALGRMWAGDGSED